MQRRKLLAKDVARFIIIKIISQLRLCCMGHVVRSQGLWYLWRALNITSVTHYGDPSFLLSKFYLHRI